MELIDFLRVETDSQKLKVDQKFVGWASSKMAVASLVTRLKKGQKRTVAF